MVSYFHKNVKNILYFYFSVTISSFVIFNINESLLMFSPLIIQNAMPLKILLGQENFIVGSICLINNERMNVFLKLAYNLKLICIINCKLKYIFNKRSDVKIVSITILIFTICLSYIENAHKLRKTI